MKSLLFVFSLMAVQLTGSADSYVKLEQCTRALHMQHVNLTSIIECMSRAANLTAYMEETLFRLDLLGRVLDRLRRKPQAEEYIPSPYVEIDDVLKIEGSVSSYSCQGKLHVMQALRRKIAQLNDVNDVESSLFKWPYLRSLNTIQSSQSHSRTLPQPRFRNSLNGKEDEDLSCILAKVIRKNDKG